MIAKLLMVLALGSFLSQDNRWQVVQPYNEKLERMAQCESHKHWDIVVVVHDRYGRRVVFYGGLQFDLDTWRSVGGNGYPNQNSKLEQKYRAVLLIRKRGYQPWPHCGYN